MSLYERILSEMAIKGIKYASELERRAGLTNGAMRNIKNGHLPTPDRLSRIADVLGVSIQYLLTGETDSEKHEPDEIVKRRKQIYCLLEGLSPAQFENAIHYLNYLKGLDEK